MSEPELTAEFVADFKALFEDPRPVLMPLSRYQAWCLMATVQLASKHPEGASTTPIQASITIARGLQDEIANTPMLKRVAEQGWTG